MILKAWKAKCFSEKPPPSSRKCQQKIQVHLHSTRSTHASSSEKASEREHHVPSGEPCCVIVAM